MFGVRRSILLMGGPNGGPCGLTPHPVRRGCHQGDQESLVSDLNPEAHQVSPSAPSGQSEARGH